MRDIKIVLTISLLLGCSFLFGQDQNPNKYTYELDKSQTYKWDIDSLSEAKLISETQDYVLRLNNWKVGDKIPSFLSKDLDVIHLNALSGTHDIISVRNYILEKVNNQELFEFLAEDSSKFLDAKFESKGLNTYIPLRNRSLRELIVRRLNQLE